MASTARRASTHICGRHFLPPSTVFRAFTQWRFHAGAGGVNPPPQIVARPPNLAALLTHCSHLIFRKEKKTQQF